MNEPMAVHPLATRALWAAVAAVLVLVVFLRGRQDLVVVPRLLVLSWALVGVLTAPRWPRGYAFSMGVLLPALSTYVFLAAPFVAASTAVFVVGTATGLVLLRRANDLVLQLPIHLVMHAVVRALVPSPNVDVGRTFLWWAVAFVTSSALALVWLRSLAIGREVQRRQSELEQQALLAAQAKSDFLAQISHELRTPMAGILGLAEVLLETELDEAQRGHLLDLHASSRALHALVDELLDLSKLEAHRVVLTPSGFGLEEVVRSAVVPSFVAARQRELTCSLHIDDDVPVAVMGDAARVRQVLTNLTHNAAKFTREGSIEVRVARRGGDELLFTVRDTGVGIDASDHERVFLPFEQADGSLTKRHAGTGLGLPIARRLARLMGGDITVESERDGGSTFLFTASLPRAETAAPAAVDPARTSLPTASLAGLVCVLAEDNLVNQKVAVAVLEKAGCVVVVAHDGDEAIERVQETRPDVVLMDVQMPRRDGLSATRAIRAWEKEVGGRVPIIALTAHVLDKERARMVASGMDAICSKPMRIAEVQAALGVALRGTRAAPEPPAFALTHLVESVGDEETAKAVLVKARESVTRLRADVRRATDQEDRPLLTAKVHELKGVLLTIGAHEAAQCMVVIESHLRRGDDEAARGAVAAASADLDELDRAMARHL